MRKQLFFFTSLLLSVVLFWQCGTPTEQHIYFIATNDIHATIESMPQLATLVKKYKERGEVFVMDSGDRVSGNAYVDDATEPGIPIIKLMNDIGYNAECYAITLEEDMLWYIYLIVGLDIGAHNREICTLYHGI